MRGAVWKTAYVFWGVVVCVAFFLPALRATPQQRTSSPPQPVNAQAQRKLLPDPAKSWAPADVDALQPPVTAERCALDQILSGAGARVKELTANLQRFTATERVDTSRLGHGKKWGEATKRRYKYLTVISEVRPGMLSVEEDRQSWSAYEGPPEHMVTNGLSGFALIFHPYFNPDFRMVCEGLGTWHGQAAWQIHFAQREDRVPRFHDFVVGDKRYKIKLKGRAWISADSFQVEHLDVDIVEPIPQIRLQTEHISIDYGPVQFVKRDIALWLPDNAEMYVDFHGQKVRMRHRFSQYLLFSVETSQDSPSASMGKIEPEK